MVVVAGGRWRSGAGEYGEGREQYGEGREGRGHDILESEPYSGFSRAVARGEVTVICMARGGLEMSLRPSIKGLLQARDPFRSYKSGLGPGRPRSGAEANADPMESSSALFLEISPGHSLCLFLNPDDI